MRYRYIEDLCAKFVTRAGEPRAGPLGQARQAAHPQIPGHPDLPGDHDANVLPDLQPDRRDAAGLAGHGIDQLTALTDQALTGWGVSPALHSLIIDGVFTKVGSVLSFLPIILTLFFFLSRWT